MLTDSFQVSVQRGIYTFIVMPALTYFLHFPQWWFLAQSKWWWLVASRTLLIALDRTALLSQLKALFAPYHNDRTAVGRFMGFVLRLILVAVGGVVVVVVGLVLVVGYGLWLAWPFSFFIGIRAGGWEVLWGLCLTLAAFCAYWLGYVLQPKRTLQQLMDEAEEGLPPALPTGIELREYASGRARKILRGLPPSFSTGLLTRSLADDPEVLKLFKRMELTDEQLVSRISQQSAKQSQVVALDDLADAAIKQALHHRHQYISTPDLFLGLVTVSPLVAQILADLGVRLEELSQAVEWIETENRHRGGWQWWRDENFRRQSGVDQGWTSGWTPTMKQFSYDITAQVASGQVPYIIGREQEIGQVVQILERATKNNALLIGEPGIGKSSIVDGIAQAILQSTISPALAESRVIQLDLARLLSAAKSPTDIGTLLNKSLSELTAGKTILFIDAIENLVRQDGIGTIDVKAILTPYIESGALRIIGSTTVAAYHRHIEPEASFAQHFQSVAIEEPTPELAAEILQEFTPAFEKKQGVQITMPAIQAAVELSTRYIHDRVLPEKAIDLIDEVAAYVAQRKKSTATAEDVAEVVSQKTGIPVASVSEDEATKLMNLEQLLHQRIVGQDEAVNSVADALRRSRAGLRDDKRPMAVFLFVGPTGSGKTALAKTIAQSYFGSEEAMIRLDMSEYQAPDSVNKLIGPPPGQVGYEEGGYLTTAVHNNPYTVILLDELEKAHPHIADIFLQVFDDGRLTDSIGRTSNFNSTIIIATSNAGSRSIQSAIQQGYTADQITPAVKELLSQKFFRPEFLNRFDDIVVFKPLQLTETIQVVKLMFDEIAQTIAQKNITLTISEGLVKKIAESGYDPVYGARPLRHLIQDKVENMLAKRMLSGEIKPGSTVELNEDNTSI